MRYRPGPEHIERLKDVISENRSADLIVFPELMLHGHPSETRPEGLLYRSMKALYEHRKVSIDLYKFIKSVGARVIIGELAKRGDGFLNLATYVDRDTKTSYAKTHIHWTENFIPGRELKVFETPIGKIGIAICFDGAFPEVWRVLALKGAEIMANICAVPRTFPAKYMWRRLSGAAIGNQAYILYANRAGSFFSGQSAVFSPTGEVMASAGEGEEVVNTELDLAALRRWREEELHYPFRRPLLYKDITRSHNPVLFSPWPRVQEREDILI
jgi:predicted amidohydrolase